MNSFRFSIYGLLLLLLANCASTSSLKKDKALTIVNFSKQTELDLEFELQKIPHPEKVEILLLDSLQLKTLPKNCVLFKNLKHISLAYNPNLDFNNAFELLKNLPLEFLNIKGNDLKILPKNIAELQSITDLNIAYNQLQNEVNYTRLAALKNLSELWLDHNELYKVPKTIGKLDQIIRLYIDNNFLSSLAPEMKNMKKLRVLHAGFNQLNSFPEVFIEMPGLILAHLNNNRIQSFPKIYETKKYSLKGLILDNNPIPKEEIVWAKKEFSAFFLLSFQQKK